MTGQEGKSKVFRDSVHGYISVPETYCRLFIDTPLFQRLRHIEQTSMRALYPSAHHDRFAHSLGTFHLGCIAFHAFKRNAQGLGAIDGSGVPSFGEEQWQSWCHAFQIACLMHDCGHAPFSHTFEKYYDLGKQPGERLVDRLIAAAGTPEDTENLPDTPHELVSAILVLEEFKDIIRNVVDTSVAIDPVLVARMITGWDYCKKTTDESRIESCLIKLLNGRAIDVDKLDYIIRDTWASGCDNTAIDTRRLLNAISVGHFDNGFVLAFEKSALSVIQSVVTARNYLYRWIYSHHTVTYDKWLLETAVKALHQEFGYPSNREDEFLRRLFSINAIVQSETIDGRCFSLLADCDIIHYLKKWAQSDPASEAAEWISRKHSRKALWKSYAEYCLMFPRISVESSEANEKFSVQFKSLLESWEERENIDLGAEILEAYPKQIVIDSGSVYVNMPTGTVSYSDIERGSGGAGPSVPKFFYVYIKNEHMSRLQEILNFVKASM